MARPLRIEYPAPFTRAQSILGEDDFAERFMDHVKGKKRIADIPKSQRFVARPPQIAYSVSASFE